MNCNFATNSSAFSNSGNKIHKRSTRNRRRKNKIKHPCLNSKKKIPRKFAAMNCSNHSRCYSKQFPFPNSKIHQLYDKNVTSNWYWSNYRKAFDWQSRHALARWKAYASALEQENEYLKQIIQNSTSNASSQNLNLLDGESKTDCSDCNVIESDSDNAMEFEMSEEMIQFFQQSLKHKIELKKEKDEKENEAETDKMVKELQSHRLKRNSEMEFLYGEEASKITGMETAIQLSFDRYCDTKSPKYWPNIPLKL